HSLILWTVSFGAALLLAIALALFATKRGSLLNAAMQIFEFSATAVALSPLVWALRQRLGFVGSLIVVAVVWRILRIYGPGIFAVFGGGFIFSAVRAALLLALIVILAADWWYSFGNFVSSCTFVTTLVSISTVSWMGLKDGTM